MPNNVTSIVQSGETLSLYATMYGVSTEDIKEASGIKGNSLKVGQTITIPIGQKAETKKEDKDLTYQENKTQYWDNQIEEKRMALYNPDLSSEEREKLEAEYIELKNTNNYRKSLADVKVSDDGEYVTLTFKKNEAAWKVRSLFNLESGSLKTYLRDNNRVPFIQGQGWVPDQASLREGDSVTISIRKFNNQGFFTEAAHFFGLD